MESIDLNFMQSELEFYRQNQTAVESEIRSLIADNQKLSQQVGMLLRERLHNARQEQSQDFEGREMEDLGRQLALLTKERDSLNVLWQTSQKTIDALETELKIYQNYNNKEEQNGHESRRDLELKLETALTDYINLEAKYKELYTKYNSLENELKTKEKETISYKERGKQVENKLEELTKTLHQYKINLAAEKKNNEDVKNQLIICHKESLDKVRREADAKAKVAEALQLFDVVSAQKNDAYKKLSIITGELAQVKQALVNVKRELESSFREELDETKDKYNEKVADMLQHIRNLDTELVEKGMLLNKTLRENKVLQDANTIFLQEQKDCLNAVDPKLTLAEQRTEAMFQELVASERRNITLVCEKQCLAIDIQRIQDIHARETKRRDWEENLLKTRCDELRMQVEHLQKSLEETHGMINKLQNMLTSRTELNQKMVSTKEDELLELNKHLENQMELSKKWKESYVEMTEKLKKRLGDMQKDNKELKAKLKIKNTGTPSLGDSTSS